MFATHSIFKHPLQLDPNSSVWVAVELAFATPWLIATFLDSDESAYRSLLLVDETLLLRLTNQGPFGDLLDLHIVQSPAWSETKTWSFLPVVKVQRAAAVGENMVLQVYLTVETGMVYSGFPLELMGQTPAELSTCWIRRSA